MHLAEALGIQGPDEIDPNRPLKLGPFELGAEAVQEAIRILSTGETPYEVRLAPRSFSDPVYWSVAHSSAGSGELFGFPPNLGIQLPTVVEVALVKAVAVAQPTDHDALLAGGREISIGPSSALSDFSQIIGTAHPVSGRSILFGSFTQVLVRDEVTPRLTSVVKRCLKSSFEASPLKFRYLELYRVIEARFLADVKTKLFSSLDIEPGVALSDAQEALKSEMNQMLGLAETQQAAFEACWTALDQIRNTNRFATALFRRVAKRKENSGARWETGAALIYQIRCAIVHAGGKDLIFESFIDGDDVLHHLIPHLERAALLLVGIELS